MLKILLKTVSTKLYINFILSDLDRTKISEHY